MNEHSNRFWQLVEPEYPRVRGFCHRLAGNPSDGDDLLQGALVKALNGFGRLKHPAAFRGWLYRIIINTFRSRSRRRWHFRLMPLTREIEETIVGERDPAARHAAQRRLKIAMARLSPKDRALVILFELEGWTLVELSEMTGLSIGSLKTRLSRIRARMRREIVRGMKGSTRDVMKEHMNPGKDTVCTATKPAGE